MVLIQCSLSGLIKFHTNIRLNRLSDLLGPAKQKALLNILIKTFLQKCILNANATFMDCAVEAKCFRKNSVKKKFQTNWLIELTYLASKTDIEKKIREVLNKLS